MKYMISVIMPVYNETLSELRSSISSILNQTYKNFEFIIIDDNPHSDYMRKFLIKIAKHDNRVRLLFDKKNKGAVFAANKGLANSTGEFIARMDADDIANSNRLQVQLNFCKKYDLDFSSSNYLNFVNSKLEGTRAFINVSQTRQYKIRRTMKVMNLAVGPTLFFRRSILKQIGYYRNILNEDYDLAARALIYGYRIGFLSALLVYKRDRPGSQSEISALKEFIILNIISIYLRKYHCTKVIPLSVISKKLNNINNKNYIYYRKFLKSSLNYKKTGTFTNNIKRYFWACSTKIIFKRNLFVLFCKFMQYLLLK